MSLHQYLYYHDIIYQPASKNIRNKDKWIFLFSLSRKSKAFPLSDPFRLFSLVFPIRTFPGTTSLRRIARNRRTWRKRAIAAAAKTTTTARAGAKITSTSRNLTFIRPANKWFQSLNWWKTPFFLGIAHIGGHSCPILPRRSLSKAHGLQFPELFSIKRIHKIANWIKIARLKNAHCCRAILR